MSGPVRIPADVDRPDRVLAGLTARQVAILAATAALVYSGWWASRTLLAPLVFAAFGLPVVLAGIAVAIGRRDGMSLEHLARVALVFHTRPRLLRRHAHPQIAAPGWAAARARHTHPRAGRAGRLRLPADRIDPGTEGVAAIDLGAQGVAVIAAASTVNFALRTDTEQTTLSECFARLLHAQAGPLQILLRAQPLNLAPALGELAEAAAALPHPALRTGAAGHHQWLAHLAATHTLLSRQVLLVLREPAHPGAPARLDRRLEQVRRALGPAEITVTALDLAQAHAVLAAASDPTHPHPAAPAGPRAPLTRLLHPLPPHPHLGAPDEGREWDA